MDGAGYQREEQEKEARKLRELFKGRFSDQEAVEILRQQGSLSDAVDFVLNSDPTDVRQFINDRNNTLVETLRRDSEYVQNALAQGLEATIRLFACEGCDRYWWRKVPARKEVSRCRLCRTKYDPVPQDKEWGLGQFICVCGNEFWGRATMNETKSPCYKCDFRASPRRIVPPTGQRRPKKRTPHSCTALNCHNRADDHFAGGHWGIGGGGGGGVFGGGGGGGGAYGGGEPASPGGGRGRGTGRGGGGGRGGGSGGYYPADNHPDDMCTHPRSTRKRQVLYPSQPHVSTGSTVNTFMSQGGLQETYDEGDLHSLPGVPEVDED